MPGTEQELFQLCVLFCEGAIMPDSVPEAVWTDGTTITPEECHRLLNMAVYYWTHKRRYKGRAQRKAMRLLRSLLTPAQRATLAQGRYFYVQAASGAIYRLWPGVGTVEAVEPHGRRFFGVRNFCLHDYPSTFDETLPAADISLVHLLLLSSDEAEFLAIANAREVRRQLWNGDYLRQVRRPRPTDAAPEGAGVL